MSSKSCISAVSMALVLSACASSSAPLSLVRPAPASSLACVARAAEGKGYAQVRAIDESTLLFKRERKPSVAREALARLTSFGMVTADQGREDRLLVSRSAKSLRVDVVGVLENGSDVPATEAGRQDAREVMNACM